MRTRILSPPTCIFNRATRIFNRAVAHRALALAALLVGLEPLLVSRLGSHAPGWSHWLCSVHATANGPHTVGGGWLDGALHTTLAVLAVHWPHFLPLLLALGTLLYLWRADAAWRAGGSLAAEATLRADAPGPLSARTSRTLSG